MFYHFLRFPFDWKNPIGFCIAAVLQCTMYTTGVKISACTVATAIGLYLYEIAMSKCIKQSLCAIGQSIRSKAEPELLEQQFIEYIELDSKVKR